MSDDSQKASSALTMAKVIYGLYLVGLVVGGLTSIVGLVIAYVTKDEAPEWLKSHFQFQIRTFWIGLLFIIAGSLLSIIVIGWFVLLFWLVWLIVRCIKGFKALDNNQPIENPTRWGM